MSLIVVTTHVMDQDYAEAVVERLNGDPEEDWTYEVRKDPKGSGRAVIDVFDEDGELLGQL